MEYQLTVNGQSFLLFQNGTLPLKDQDAESVGSVVADPSAASDSTGESLARQPEAPRQRRIRVVFRGRALQRAGRRELEATRHFIAERGRPSSRGEQRVPEAGELEGLGRGQGVHSARSGGVGALESGQRAIGIRRPGGPSQGQGLPRGQDGRVRSPRVWDRLGGSGPGQGVYTRRSEGPVGDPEAPHVVRTHKRRRGNGQGPGSSHGGFQPRC